MNYIISTLIIIYSAFLFYSLIKKNEYYTQIVSLIPTKNIMFKKVIILFIITLCTFSSYLILVGELDYKINLLP